MAEKESTERMPRLKKWMEKVIKEKPSHRTNAAPEGQVNDTDGVTWDWEHHVQEISDFTEKICNFSFNRTPEVRADDIAAQRWDREDDVGDAEMHMVDGTLKRGRWVIALHDKRLEELEQKIKEDRKVTNEATMQLNVKNMLNSDLSTATDLMIGDLKCCLEEKEIILSKLQKCHMEQLQLDTQHEKAASSAIFTEVEVSRIQNNVLRRRMEACKENDAFEELTHQDKDTLAFREYTAMEIKFVTDNFSPTRRFNLDEEQDGVYRASIDHATVAVKRFDSRSHRSPEAFVEMVQKMHDLRHQNLVRVLGFCSELRCVVFEYMAGGSLKEVLLPVPTRKTNRRLNLHDRIRIACEVCDALCHLHSAHPDPIVHGHLALSSVLLDPTFSAKLIWPDLSCHRSRRDTWTDVRDLGILIVSLLREYKHVLSEEVDEIASFCAGATSMYSTEGIIMSALSVRLGELRHRVVRQCDEESSMANSVSAPAIFLCPIRQVVMKDPHTAADGFSYEKEAIEEWMGRGRDTSPITNCKLNHNFLMPNISLRYMIQEWIDFSP